MRLYIFSFITNSIFSFDFKHVRVLEIILSNKRQMCPHLSMNHFDRNDHFDRLIICSSVALRVNNL